MNTRTLRLALIASLLVIAGSFAAACGDDGGGNDGDALTLEEFFQRIDVLDDEYEARTEALEAEFDEAFADVESVGEVIDAAQSFFDEGAAAIENFVEGIADIDPPAEAENLHDRVVEAGRTVVELFSNAIDEIEEISTEEEFEALFEDSAIDDAFDRFTVVCLEVQAMANDNGFDVEYNCDDEEE